MTVNSQANSTIMRIFLGLALFCSLYLVRVESSGYNFPNIDEMKEMFGKMADKVKSSWWHSDEVKSTRNRPEKIKKSRRQASNIGDESLLPYEVKSSRYILDLMLFLSSKLIRKCIHYKLAFYLEIHSELFFLFG